MRLDGVAVAGYRSFGDELQRVGPLEQVNLLAGPNNSGKSNVLRFVHNLLPLLISGKANQTTLDPLDRHRPHEPPLRFAVATALGSDHYEHVLKLLGNNGKAKDALNGIMSALADDDGLLWWPFSVSTKEVALDQESFLSGINVEAYSGQFADVGTAVSNLSRSNSITSFVREFLKWCDKNRPTLPSVVFVPAVRQIGTSAPADSGDLTGADLVQRLAELQNPSIHDQHKKTQFRAINDFVRAVTDDSHAEIEIPIERDTIHVHLGTQVLPLENLGSGIHEVTMLAAWSTVFDNYIVCLEEPEIHLHPLLQRKLLRHIETRTNNQYLIATHSAHFLDQPNARVFHARWDGSQTKVTEAISPSQRVELCADLGYRASDLLQSNAVIWVEGPSDRLYVRHWLSAIDSDLIEGVHYSLMFYGGRLLSHLSADDIEIEDFISLRRINQWLAIIIDSDRSSKGQRLTPTKRRVQSEFDNGPGFGWITQGREVENYVPDQLLSQAIGKTHPSAKRVAPSNMQYDDVTMIELRGEQRSIDKVKVAHYVADQKPDLSVLDLGRQVRRLADFVRSANGLQMTG